MKYSSSFSHDLNFGEKAEDWINELFSNGKLLEVKNDRMIHKTGNLFIEESCFYQGSGSWALSGIAVSKASHWAFVLDNNVIIVPRGHLIDVVKKFGRPIENKQPPNQSKGHLITPAQLINYKRIMNEEFDQAGEVFKNYMEQGYPV